jgi:phosphatidylglycerophosphate synthase
MTTRSTIHSIAGTKQNPSHEALGRRRPMKFREFTACTRIASALNTAGVTPNQISIAGLAAGLGVGLALAMTNHAETAALERWFWGLAILGMLLRGAGNILDGVLAVECGRSTPIGHLYNEIPDRISDIAMLAGAGYAAGGQSVLGWMAATMALFIAYTRVQVDVAGARQSFIGPMAKPARVAVIAIAALIHVAAPHWSHQCMENFGGWGPVSGALAVIIIGGAVTAARRLATAARELQNDPAS